MHSASARLTLAASQAVPAFRAVAEASGLTSETQGDGLHIALLRGSVTVRPEGTGTAVVVDSPTAAGLQLIRDLLAERIGEAGMALDWAGARGGQRPGNLSVARVCAVTKVSPSYLRVVVEGEDLARFAKGGLHFRLLFGPAGADWPVTDDAGITQWPGGAAAWHRPVYTTREITVAGEAACITFDVFRHEGGRVTDWAARAVPGDEIALTGPGGGEVPEPPGWLGLVGDETAVPVMARILAEMPASVQGEAVLFVPGPADVQALRRPPGVNLRWVMRGADEGPLDALRTLRIPDAGRHVFFAAERSEASTARAWLPQQGFKRGEFVAAAYWDRD